MFEAETSRRLVAALMPDNAIVEMLLIKGSSDGRSSDHLTHALHKQASISASKFERWEQRLVYQPAGRYVPIMRKIAASTLYGPAPAETNMISMNAYRISGR